MASYRFVWHPKWLAGHVLVLVVAAAMVGLGRWQMIVSDSKGFDLQNFGYALQWWAFSIFGVGFWIKLIRDRGRPKSDAEPAPRPEPRAVATPAVAYRRYVMPQQADAADDPELARYNAYLADLNSGPDDAGRS